MPHPTSAAAALARYYDLDVAEVRDDVDMYLRLARGTEGPILELAAGTGRIALALARAGHDVTALDIEPAMLGRARAAWRTDRAASPASPGRLRFIEADLTTFRSDERFGLAILALDSILLMPDEAAKEAALRTMAIHLRPGGLAVVDHIDPNAGELASWDGRLQLEWVRPDPETGDLVTKLVSARREADASQVTLVQLFDAVPASGGSVRRLSRVDALHLVTPASLRRLARRAGLTRVELAGDHLLTPHGPGSQRVILLGRSV